MVEFCAMLLAACDGSSSALRGGGTDTPAPTDPVTSVTLVSSATQMAADRSNRATSTATDESVRFCVNLRESEQRTGGKG